MAGLFGGGTSVSYSTPEPMPKVEDLTTENAARSERLRRLRAYGSTNTIMAGNAGAPSVVRKTLGGA